MRAICILLLICACNANSQMRRRTTQQPGGAIGGAYHQPAAAMHGILKKITGKDIIIVVEGDQAVTIDRTRKTKFLRDGKEIKPAEIAIGSVLTIDVSHDPELNPLAMNVMVDSGPTDQAAPDSSPAKPVESPNP